MDKEWKMKWKLGSFRSFKGINPKPYTVITMNTQYYSMCTVV